MMVIPAIFRGGYKDVFLKICKCSNMYTCMFWKNLFICHVRDGVMLN